MTTLRDALTQEFAMPAETTLDFLASPPSYLGQVGFYYDVATSEWALYRASGTSLSSDWVFIAGERYYVADPTGVTTPRGKGEWYTDTGNNVVYKAKGETSADWIAC